MDARYLFQVMFVNGLFEGSIDPNRDWDKLPSVANQKEEFFEKHKSVFHWLADYVTSLEDELKKSELLKTPKYLICDKGTVKLPTWKELPKDSEKGTWLEGVGVEQRLCTDGKYVYLFELKELPKEPNETDEA